MTRDDMDAIEVLIPVAWAIICVLWLGLLGLSYLRESVRQRKRADALQARVDVLEAALREALK